MTDDEFERELAAVEAQRTAGREFDWGGVDQGRLALALGRLLGAGYAVRVSRVGYGLALRFSATDARGWTAGWTLASGEELSQLLGGLLAAGGLAYVERCLERPQKRR